VSPKAGTCTPARARSRMHRQHAHAPATTTRIDRARRRKRARATRTSLQLEVVNIWIIRRYVCRSVLNDAATYPRAPAADRGLRLPGQVCSIYCCPSLSSGGCAHAQDWEGCSCGQRRPAAHDRTSTARLPSIAQRGAASCNMLKLGATINNGLQHIRPRGNMVQRGATKYDGAACA
jgi:hypothetical protein